MTRWRLGAHGNNGILGRHRRLVPAALGLAVCALTMVTTTTPAMGSARLHSTDNHRKGSGCEARSQHATPARLCLEKTPDRHTVHPGDPVTFTVVVHNPGPATASDVTVSDPVAPACDKAIGTLAAGSTTSYTCTVTAGADSADTATVTGTDPEGERVGASDGPRVSVLDPEITLDKTVTPTQVRPGDAVTYSFVVTNMGNATLSKVSVSDARYPDCGGAALGTLAPGESTSYTCTVLAGQADFVNVATASGTDALGRRVSDADEATLDVVHPGVSIDQAVSPSTAAPGATVTYAVTVTNSGDVGLTDLVVADPMASGCAATRGALVPGESWRYSCEALLPPGGVSTASVTGQPPLGPPVTAADAAAVNVATPSMTIAKTVDQAVAEPGDPLTFTVTVTNPGLIDLGVVTVDPSFPTECSRELPLVAAGESVSYRCTVPAPVDDVVASVVGRGTPVGGGETVVATDSAPVDVIHPAVEIVTDGPSGPVHAGDDAIFHVTLRNPGDVGLADVAMRDQFGCDRSVGDLAAGEEVSYKCVVREATADLIDEATVTGRVPADPRHRRVEDAANASVDVIRPRLAVDTVVRPTMAREGDPVSYRISVRNTGDVELVEGRVAAEVPDECARDLPDPFAPGAELVLECAGTAPAADFVSTATASGIDPSGDPVTASDEASLDVVHPALAVTTTAPPGGVRPGGKLRLRVEITNAGDVPLADLATSEDSFPACSRTGLGALAVGATTSFRCTVVVGTDDFTSRVQALGSPPVGGPVTASDDVDVDVVQAGIEVSKTASQSLVMAGTRVAFAVVVTNTGDLELTDVAVDDAGVPACSTVLPSLAAGESKVVRCTAVVTDDLISVVVASATPGLSCGRAARRIAACGDPLSDRDQVTVWVDEPGTSLAGGPTGGATGAAADLPDPRGPGWVLPLTMAGALLVGVGVLLAGWARRRVV